MSRTISTLALLASILLLGTPASAAEPSTSCEICHADKRER